MENNKTTTGGLQMNSNPRNKLKMTQLELHETVIKDSYEAQRLLLKRMRVANGDWTPDWNKEDIKYCIPTVDKPPLCIIEPRTFNVEFLAFKDMKTAQTFLEDNCDLITVYFKQFFPKNYV